MPQRKNPTDFSRGSCQACDFELEYAIELQDKHGLFYGSGVGQGITHRTHFLMRMVDAEGKVVVE
jgi:hypothetical protein